VRSVIRVEPIEPAIVVHSALYPLAAFQKFSRCRSTLADGWPLAREATGSHRRPAPNPGLDRFLGFSIDGSRATERRGSPLANNLSTLMRRVSYWPGIESQTSSLISRTRAGSR
jgi:hypothetical protein